MLLGMSGAFKFYHWFSPMVTGASVLSNDSATNMPRSESIMQYTEYCPTSTNLTWTTSLAKPCHSLVFSGGKAVAGTGATGKWSSPDNNIGKSYMHHNAVYEMRTNMADTHGNQATFDGTGAIITSGIRAGTADFYAPYDEDGDLRWNFNHRNSDVYPYIRALLLDGNPSPPTRQWIPKKLARPPLVQGGNAGKYLTCRPTIY